MIATLTWIALISGGFLIIILLLSIFSSIDFDIDVDMGSTDVDAGGLGVLKGGLTFISVSAWVIKLMLTFNNHPWVAVLIGLASGVLAFYILRYLLRILLRNESNVNYNMEDALFQKGTVYLRIPANGGSGIINIEIKGAQREFKAKTSGEEEIETGANVVVVDVIDEFAIVEKQIEP